MKKLLILGAGTAGTIMLNRLRRRLDPAEWQLTIVDRDPKHYYQPGFLFLPFGIYEKERVVRRKADFFPKGVTAVWAEVERIEGEASQVHLADGRVLEYDVLIVATGVTPRPEETPGLSGKLWFEDAFDFYTYEGAVALADKLATWEGGRLVVSVAESLIKCPIAPLEFLFLADAYFEDRGLRDRVEITYVTPLSGAFTKPLAAHMLGDMLEHKRIHVEPDFYLMEVDEDAKELVSYDERRVSFDLLVSVPTNMGDDLVERSGLGDDDDLNFIRTDKHTLQSEAFENVFVLGDATNVPTSKAGSVAHFEAEILTENVLSYIEGRPMEARFDGHANCFIETGHGKATLIDFNYDTEPLPGKFPLPGVGPFDLLRESRLNHAGKLVFEWVYWHLLLKGYSLPVPTHMSMMGKEPPPTNGQPPSPQPADGQPLDDQAQPVTA